MRWLYLIVIVLFVAIAVIFAVQNLQLVTIAFLGFRVTVPIALLSGVMYLLGMATGGSLLALLRWLVEGARRRPPGTS
jgi:uncharacterized integral membrane protein